MKIREKNVVVSKSQEIEENKGFPSNGRMILVYLIWQGYQTRLKMLQSYGSALNR
jgi:hypothetical protein